MSNQSCRLADKHMAGETKLQEGYPLWQSGLMLVHQGKMSYCEEIRQQCLGHSCDSLMQQLEKQLLPQD